MAAGPKRWFFDAWSWVYDLPAVQRAVYRPPQNAVLAELRRAGARRVLDVGCGTGLLAARIRRELPDVLVAGLDFSAGMLAHARGRDPRGRWIRGDGARLPFRTAAFDAVVSTEAFHWFPDPDAALAEFHRVLRPGGRLVLALVSPRLALTGEIARRASTLVGQPFVWPTAEALRERLEQASFSVERQARLFRVPGVLVFPPMLHVARRQPR